MGTIVACVRLATYEDERATALLISKAARDEDETFIGRGFRPLRFALLSDCITVLQNRIKGVPRR